MYVYWARGKSTQAQTDIYVLPLHPEQLPAIRAYTPSIRRMRQLAHVANEALLECMLVMTRG